MAASGSYDLVSWTNESLRDNCDIDHLSELQKLPYNYLYVVTTVLCLCDSRCRLRPASLISPRHKRSVPRYVLVIHLNPVRWVQFVSLRFRCLLPSLLLYYFYIKKQSPISCICALTCAAVLQPWASFFHSTLLKFTRLYK